MPRTTVVIPNYKGIHFIEECLRSVFRSSVPVEVILVDNASEDGSLALVREQFPQVKVTAFHENKGFSAAVNAGIESAGTEYVLLLNNDTVVEEKLVEYLERSLDQYPQAFSAAPKMICMKQPDRLDGTGDFYCALGWAFARGKDRPVDGWEKPGRVFSSCGGCALYRREIFSLIGLFDEDHFAYLEDIDVGYRANLNGYASRYVPEAVVYHAGSAVSGSRHNEFKVRLSARNSVYLVYKNMPFLQAVLNLPFLLAGYLCKACFFFLKGLGRAYVQGFIEGMKLSFSVAGRRQKVGFRWKNLKNYFWVQGQLWINMVRMALSCFGIPK